MPFITVDLLRRKAEHNEGCLSTLVEIALHQLDLERIEVIGDMCRDLEILYLCNNYIPRIEGLTHLKKLTYLNLAVNNITVIEGLEGCEMLRRLDLTLNFIADISSVGRLRANTFLENLHLTGNPCCSLENYRSIVVGTLPQLISLDSEEIVRSERIAARQDDPKNHETAVNERIRVFEENMAKEAARRQGIDPCPPKYDDKGERLYGHTPEERLQMLRDTEDERKRKEDEAKRMRDPNSISAIHEEMNRKATPLTPEQELEKYGRILQRNEAKVPYKITEHEDHIEIMVEPGKYVSTSLIAIDAQPTYVRVTIKGKVLQLVLPQEISPSKVAVQRASTTGHLKLVLPLAAHVLEEIKSRKTRYATDAIDE